MIAISLQLSGDFFKASLFPGALTLDHYDYVLSHLPFLRMFLNTATMAAATLTDLPIFIIYLILQWQVIDSFVKSGLH